MVLLSSQKMMLFLSSICLAVSFVTCTVSSPSSSASFVGSSALHNRASVFGVPRGGGLFGKKDDNPTATTTDEGAKTMYPPMTQQEIEEWLEHVPVYAVTDANGAGVVLKPENDTSVFYFFLNPIQANATLTQLQGSKAGDSSLDLKVSAFSLGKIWFNLLNNADHASKEVKLQQPGNDGDESTTTTTTGVQYRIVPDTRDLLGARMLLTMSPEDGEKLKESGSMTPEMAQAAIKKAMTESPKFKETYNEIPVFTIAQMRMQRTKAEEPNTDDEDTTLLPMYFSLQNMVGTWQQFMSQAPPEVQGTEPAINLLSLHEIIAMMQKESEIDWRHVVLVPTAAQAESSDVTAAATPADPMAQMGGATLGDD